MLATLRTAAANAVAAAANNTNTNNRPPFQRTRLSYQPTSRRLSDIVGDDSIQIPEHQRPEMWKANRQSRLIDTVMRGLPMPPLLLREDIQDNRRIRWLEDGQQRYISLKKFVDNRLTWRGRHYRDLTEDERVFFNSYQVPILSFEGATQEEVIAIFDNFQNGVPLTPGQRYHAQLTMPLVSYARSRLLTPGQHFYARAAAVWGRHDANDDTKTKKHLMNAMALAGGAAHGVEFITTSYDVLGPMLQREFDAAAADRTLDRVIRVFEAADVRHPITAQARKRQWDAGSLSGYILASLLEHPEQQEQLMEAWTDYIVGCRAGTNTLDLLHRNKPASRNWNSERWRIGFRNVFEMPEEGEAASASTGRDYGDTDDEDDE